MNNINIKLLIVLMFLMGVSWAQSSAKSKQFGEMDTEFQEPLIEEMTVKTFDQYTPIERPIDANSYILGPGDVLGLNIVTAENMTFTLQVNPTGDLLIPTVGIISIAGLTLKEAIESIKSFIVNNVYRNSVVSVTLVDVRQFKVLVIGGVQEPGFVTATSVDRLTDVISEAGGLHKYADEERIKIIKGNGDTKSVSIKQFLLGADLNHNPTLQEGDRIEVPFLPDYQQEAQDFATYKESAIFVTGFVKYPGAFRYFPGYSIQDYIGMAGGILESGDSKKVQVLRANSKGEIGLNDYVIPGDTIYIPENIRSRLLGNVGIIQTISAIAGLYLSYRAATKKY